MIVNIIDTTNKEGKNKYIFATDKLGKEEIFTDLAEKYKCLIVVN